MFSSGVSTNQFCEHLLIKCRLINANRLQLFTSSNKNLYKRVRKQLGWSKVIANVALNAYNEFLELKLITKDFKDSNIIPSWCVREVWKTHALCDTVDYEDGCKGLCGQVIKYQIEVKPDPECDVDSSGQFTENVYQTRFNRNLPKPIWSFKFNPLWKNEYQTENDMKHSKRIKEIKNWASGSSTTDGEKNADKDVNKDKKGKTSAEKNKTTLVTPIFQKQNNVASFYNKTTLPPASNNNAVNSSASNSDNIPGPSSQNEEPQQNSNSAHLIPTQQTPQQSDNSTQSTPSLDNTNKKRKGTKRKSPLRNPVMTRSRTKVLKIDV